MRVEIGKPVMTSEKESGWLGGMTKGFRRKLSRDRCGLESRTRRGRKISEVDPEEFQVFTVQPSVPPRSRHYNIVRADNAEH